LINPEDLLGLMACVASQPGLTPPPVDMDQGDEYLSASGEH
jgi:hypothetical protein